MLHLALYGHNWKEWHSLPVLNARPWHKSLQPNWHQIIVPELPVFKVGLMQTWALIGCLTLPRTKLDRCQWIMHEAVDMVTFRVCPPSVGEAACYVMDTQEAIQKRSSRLTVYGLPGDHMLALHHKRTTAYRPKVGTQGLPRQSLGVSTFDGQADITYLQ